MVHEWIKCQFEEILGPRCPVPRTSRISWNESSGLDTNNRLVMPGHGIRYNWHQRDVSSAIPEQNICPRCHFTKGIKTVLRKDTGDFCPDCIPHAREWSPSWCWAKGEPGHSLPNGQCDHFVDNGQWAWRKTACPVHDAWQYDSNGEKILHDHQFLRKEEIKRDNDGEFVLGGGSKVQIRRLWPDNLEPQELSGAWYVGRDVFSGSLDYPPDYEWADYSKYRHVNRP